ncbi:MAG: outer membrane beta-barrel protein [Idiomarina sp.]
MTKGKILATIGLLTFLPTDTAIANAEFSIGIAQHRADFRLASRNSNFDTTIRDHALDSTILTFTGRYYYSDNFSVGARALTGINDTDDFELSGGLNNGYEVFVGTQYRLGKQWSFVGDAGLGYSDVEYARPRGRSDIRYLGPILRVGLAYEFSPNINLNMEYTWLDRVSDDHVGAEKTQTLGLSIGYRF